MIIPPEAVGEFFQSNFAELAHRYTLRGNELISGTISEAPPQPRLYLTEHKGLLRAALRFAYDGYECIAAKKPPEMTYVTKPPVSEGDDAEAVLSSQIESTQSSLADLLLYESHETLGVPLEDVAEVSSYVAALQHGIQRLRSGFPLSLRLLREVHEILLATGRGSNKAPGTFRRSQNWIDGTRPGNARFVPPPPERVLECMSALEKFLHDQPTRTPLLIKAALTHVQFETIHPFLDGNGRVGRLLITCCCALKPRCMNPFCI